MNKDEKRAVLTVIGRDRVGIIARVTKLLADYNVNIEDISQTILKDIFNMIMMVDFSEIQGTLEELRGDLDILGRDLGVSIILQQTAIFDSMHRI